MISIRTASPSDIPALVELCAQLGYPSTESEISQRLADMSARRDHLLLVAELDSGEVVGWVHGVIRRLLIVPPHVELGGLVVDESWRGQGTGQGLMAGIESWAASQECDTVFVRSNIIREGAHRFYEGLGYHQDKTSLTFIKEVGADVYASSHKE